MSVPVLLYALASLAVVLSAIAAIGAWRPSRSVSSLGELRLEELLEDLKGEIVTELAQARAAVESGMHYSGEAYMEAQRVLADQVDAAVLRLRSELLDANAQSQQVVQGALETVFQQAQLVQTRSLAEQALLLKDLKMNYERAIADLRAAVNQASAKQNETLGGISGQFDDSLAALSDQMKNAAGNFARLDERLEALVQTLEGRLAERV